MKKQCKAILTDEAFEQETKTNYLTTWDWLETIKAEECVFPPMIIAHIAVVMLAMFLQTAYNLLKPPTRISNHVSGFLNTIGRVGGVDKEEKVPIAEPVPSAPDLQKTIIVAAEPEKSERSPSNRI